MENKTVAKMAEAIFEELVRACDTIKDAGACESCPLYGNCIEETNAIAIFCEQTEKTIDEYLGFADDVRKYAERSAEWED